MTLRTCSMHEVVGVAKSYNHLMLLNTTGIDYRAVRIGLAGVVVAGPKFSKQASRPLYIFLALSRRIVVQLSTVNMSESHFTVVQFQLTKGQLGLISQVMLYTTTLRSCYSLNINSKSSTGSCMCFSLSQIVVNLTSTTVCTCRYGTYSHSQ